MEIIKCYIFANTISGNLQRYNKYIFTYLQIKQEKCSRCNKEYSLKKNGNIRQHKCIIIIPSSTEQSTSISQESVKSSNNRQQPNLPGYKQSNPSLNTNWGGMSGKYFSTQVNEVYDEITEWRKMSSSYLQGNMERLFTSELTSWLSKFNSDSPYQCIALKAFMILPSILLQKPPKKSKAKEHSVSLERRLRQWHLGELNLIRCECREIQRKL